MLSINKQNYGCVLVPRVCISSKDELFALQMYVSHRYCTNLYRIGLFFHFKEHDSVIWIKYHILEVSVIRCYRNKNQDLFKLFFFFLKTRLNGIVLLSSSSSLLVKKIECMNLVNVLYFSYFFFLFALFYYFWG